MPKWIKQWSVPSASDPDKKPYTVSLGDDGKYACSCMRWTRTFPRENCSHIKRVLAGDFDPIMGGKKADYVLAKVLKPKYLKTKNQLLIPLIALGPAGVPMEATIDYQLLKHGWSMPEIREQRHLPKEWTKEAVFNYIDTHGEAEYPENWYGVPEKKYKAASRKRVKKADSGISTAR